MGISLPIVYFLGFNNDSGEFPFLILTILFGLPIYKLILFIINKQIGPPEV